MSPRSRAAIAAIMIATAGLAASTASSAPYERHPIYAVGGNHFIVRTYEQGGTLYLRAFRQAGHYWERFGARSIPLDAVPSVRAAVRQGGGSMIERIYFGSPIVGYSDVDLDNLHNLLLNKTFNE